MAQRGPAPSDRIKRQWIGDPGAKDCEDRRTQCHRHQEPPLVRQLQPEVGVPRLRPSGVRKRQSIGETDQAAAKVRGCSVIRHKGTWVVHEQSNQHRRAVQSKQEGYGEA